MIRLKNGLIKWSNANKEFAAKTNLLFSATHDIAQLIPDVANTTDIQVRFINYFLGRNLQTVNQFLGRKLQGEIQVHVLVYVLNMIIKHFKDRNKNTTFQSNIYGRIHRQKQQLVKRRVFAIMPIRNRDIQMLFYSLRVQHVVSLQEPMTSFNHFLWETPNTNTSSCFHCLKK